MSFFWWLTLLDVMYTNIWCTLQIHLVLDFDGCDEQDKLDVICIELHVICVCVSSYDMWILYEH